jgi:hypothetical protein
MTDLDKAERQLAEAAAAFKVAYEAELGEIAAWCKREGGSLPRHIIAEIDRNRGNTSSNDPASIANFADKIRREVAIRFLRRAERDGDIYRERTEA